VTKTTKKSVHNRVVDGVKESSCLVLWLESGLSNWEMQCLVEQGGVESFLVQVLVVARLQEFRLNFSVLATGDGPSWTMNKAQARQGTFHHRNFEPRLIIYEGSSCTSSHADSSF
jgi:predicted PhzF superfamily epimerase YddE/YHI9